MRKKKHSNVLFDSSTLSSTLSSMAQNEINESNQIKTDIMQQMHDVIPSVIEEKKTIEVEQSRLLAENVELTEKLSEYILENEKLRNELSSTKDFQIQQLSSELESARNDIDNYLIRISELTFDNAKLHADVDQLKSAQAVSQNNMKFPPQQNIQHKQSNPVIYNPYMINGYESWN